MDRSGCSNERPFWQMMIAGMIIVMCLAPAQGRIIMQSTRPGNAHASLGKGTLALSNSAIAANWTFSGGSLKAVSIEDRLAGTKITSPGESFVLTFQDGRVIDSSGMRIIGAPRIIELKGNPRASRLSERLDGRAAEVVLEDVDGRIEASWRGVLRNGSSYLRQEVALQAKKEDLPIKEIRLLDMDVAGAKVAGSVKGSPIVASDMFFAIEHPLSASTVEGQRALCAITREIPLRAGAKVAYSSVIGVTPPGQLRRGFLNYLERERAHPYRTFLHYNSWYDLGYFTKFDQAGALGRIEKFGTELTRKRGVTLSSFLFDDGWDDPATLWKFHSGFPDGFTPLKAAAAKYGAAPGVWMSPWGGYGKPKEERLKYAKEAGFETNDGGLALSGPVYYKRFLEVCLDMIRKYGVNQFKIDGTGNVNRAIPGSEFDSDFSAAIHLIQELRAAKPDLYVNLTTGTYASPFWLMYADSIWRGGNDHSFAGVGADRQQWITYRDSQTYKNIVQRGPLYPLNALMLHGLIYAQHAKKLDADPGNDFDDEVRSYFGTGTQLQEMYITPSLLSQENWDMLAEAAKWSRANQNILVDTHWIGGDPAKLEVYGWASWAAGHGILVLRNPSDKEQEFSIDIQAAFELPRGAASSYWARSPWRRDRAQKTVELRAGQVHTFKLKPFEVMTLDALAEKR